MTDERIAAIEARLAEATPGPWLRHTYGHKDTRSQVRAAGKALRLTTATLRESTGDPDIEATDLTWVEHEHGSISLIGNGPRQTDNGDFIANARDDVPWLLARLRETSSLMIELRDLTTYLDASTITISEQGGAHTVRVMASVVSATRPSLIDALEAAIAAVRLHDKATR